MCEWKPDFDRLESRLEQLEGRIGKVETATSSGLAAVNSNIETLSQQITNMDKRIIEEKTRWGETLRGIVKWTVRAILAVVTYAAGVNLTKDLLPGIFN